MLIITTFSDGKTADIKKSVNSQRISSIPEENGISPSKSSIIREKNGKTNKIINKTKQKKIKKLKKFSRKTRNNKNKKSSKPKKSTKSAKSIKKDKKSAELKDGKSSKTRQNCESDACLTSAVSYMKTLTGNYDKKKYREKHCL